MPGLDVELSDEILELTYKELAPAGGDVFLFCDEAWMKLYGGEYENKAICLHDGVVGVFCPGDSVQRITAAKLTVSR
jgi:hypothetical protein